MPGHFTIEARAELAHTHLRAAYPTPPIPLDHDDRFSLLVAVLLSAQCTDVRVNMCTPSLMKAFPDPETMAQASASEVLTHIRSLGLANSKAANLVKTAKLLVEHHGGEIPCDLADLTALAGVGRKTALVVRSQGFGIPAFPVDTHILRLAKRWKLTQATTPDRVEKDLCRLYASEYWNDLHLQIIYWGRQRCQAHRCKKEGEFCDICEVLS